jgi:tripartite-type tricarboxylate transporter receptor subunit TctC
MNTSFADVLCRSGPAIALLVVVAVANPAYAEAPYPVRPIRMVVPQAAGGTADLLSRMMGDQLERALRVPVVVDNKPGANGIVGNEVAKRAPPDGYTLLVASTATHTMSPHVAPVLSYDPVADFVPIVDLVYQTKVVLVNASLPATTLAQLIADAQSRPGRINYASTGVGSSSHLDTEQLAALGGIRMLHVPYRGSAQAIAALMADEVQVLLASVTAAQPALATGRVRALAVLSERRSPLLPSVPTLEEQGLPRLDAQTWIGVLAPAGTPPAIVQTLNRALNRILSARETRAWLEAQGLEAVGGTPEAFGAEIRADLEKWGKVTRRLGIARQ